MEVSSNFTYKHNCSSTANQTELVFERNKIGFHVAVKQRTTRKSTFYLDVLLLHLFCFLCSVILRHLLVLELLRKFLFCLFLFFLTGDSWDISKLAKG